MDRRGFTTDPNADPVAPHQWWNTLGPTQRPSPYATASWKYLQDTQTEEIERRAVIEVVYDNGAVFADYNQAIDWDGGLFNPVVPPSVVLNGGGFNSSGEIIIFEKTSFSTVYVYDSYASYPDIRGLQSIILDTGDLATDPDAIFITTEDGFTFGSEVPAQLINDTPPGTMLGQLDYTITNKRVEITGWSHYNWQDASPVKRAFQAMIASLPTDCVEGVFVKDDPTAFWQDLGFGYVGKGDTELKFFPVRYRGY
jgi:hypothetical protein